MPWFSLLPSVKTIFCGLLAVWATGSVAANYKGAIVIDVDSGAALFKDNADYVGPPASVTKLMTFLVVHDLIETGRISLNTPVTISAADSRMGGTQVWLKHNEVFPVRELLYALMVQSANDAAHALSHAAGTTRDEFVALMNQRSREIGMPNTIWRTPHGLPPRSRRLDETDQTSPRDLARLALVLVDQTDVLTYSSIEKRPFGSAVREKPVEMDNHNNLLGKVRGVDGLKTGFTRAAGFCLAATVERDGRRIIAVIMGSPSAKERDFEMINLIDRAFATDLPEPAVLNTAPNPLPPPATTSPKLEPLLLPTIGESPGTLPGKDSTEPPPAVRFDFPN